jgi:predicted amidohydrolase
MKAASVVFKKDDYFELESYESLLSLVEKRLELCCEQGVGVVVFPALLGCLFNNGERYLNDIIELSKLYKGIAICPGSCYETDMGKTYHSSCIARDGNILLTQRQLYLAKWERNMGLSRGMELDIIIIEGMMIGIVISTDAFYPQVSRALAMKGVDMVLSPMAVKGENDRIRQLTGLWQNVQSNLFFGVESGFKGSFKSNRFFSRSIIHAPLLMTEKENGFMAFEEKTQRSPIITAELDNGKRKETVKSFDTLKQLNIEAYRNVFLMQPRRPL